ncbi:4084_t:CDS:1, partial [Gigaspora rosea]
AHDTSKNRYSNTAERKKGGRTTKLQRLISAINYNDSVNAWSVEAPSID